MRKLIARPEYLKRLIENKDVDLIKVVTGIRRCGKSTLLELYRDYLQESGVPEDRIILMNLESLRYREITDCVKLYETIAGRIVKKSKTYILLDEVQTVAHWEKAIESLRLDFDVDITVTGSNAYLLSGELSTLLSGRYTEIRVLPLSFEEFIAFGDFDGTVSDEEKFRKYMQYGGMPVLHEYRFNEMRSMQALEGIYSTVVLRDVLQRNPKANQILLEKLVRFLCSTVGSITSPNSIGKVLRSERTIEKKTGALPGSTIEAYLCMLERAFFIFPVGRYDVKGKQLLKTLGKNYLIDIGFRNMLLGWRDADRGHLLENIVYLELLRRDYRVNIGKVGNTEVDFIAESAKEKIYIQVTESMQNPQTRERELRPLRLIRDNHEKTVLSMDRDFISSYDGIRSVNLIDWLLHRDR